MQLSSSADDLASYMPSFPTFLLCMVLLFGVLYVVMGMGRNDNSPNKIRAKSDAGNGKARKVQYKL